MTEEDHREPRKTGPRRSDLVISVALPLAIIVLGAAYGLDEGRTIDALVARCVSLLK